MENEISDVSRLPTKTALTAVENKIPSVSSLVRKIDYDWDWKETYWSWSW